MKYNFRIVLICAFTCLLFVCGTYAQPWNFSKEVNGIKIYTRKEVNTSLKAYKGEVILHAPMEKACSMVGNAKNFDWWGEDFKNVKVIRYEENKFVQYYFIYDLPWPLTDRDLAVNALITRDSANGEYSVMCRPLLKVIPENTGLVRITKYWQKWTIRPLDNGNVHIILEGFVDPGGNVPGWLYNMLTTELPLKTIGLLRERILSSRPANK